MKKILIASLGAGNKERKYNKTNYKIEEKVYSNEMYVASALEEHFKIDKTFYIGTLGSMWENVYEHYCEKFQKEKNLEYEEGLFYKMIKFLDSSIEDKENYSLDSIDFSELISTFDNKIIPIITYYGVNNKEIFQNFNNILSIVNELEDGDKLYLDITHSFRSNAFWIFLVMNYVNDVIDKKITIEYISYGMFEAKEKNKDGIEVTPVINLKIFFDFMKWIKGAYTLKNFGNSDLICELLEDEKIKNKVSNLSSALNMNYISSLKKSIDSLEKNYELINSVEGPAKLIIPKVISEFLEHFKGVEKEHELYLKLAKWHYKEKRYSISYINAQEAFVTYSEANGFGSTDENVSKSMDKKEVKSDMLKLSFEVFEKSKDKSKINFIFKKKYTKIFDSKTQGLLKKFFENYEHCRRIRNNISHSLETRLNPEADITSLEKILNFLEEIFKEKEFLKKCKERIELE